MVCLAVSDICASEVQCLSLWYRCFVAVQYCPRGVGSRLCVHIVPYFFLSLWSVVCLPASASCSPHSRWETVSFGVVCGNILYVRVSIGWPPAAGGGPEVEPWAGGPGFEPVIKAIKRSQNYAFNRMTADVGAKCY